jgi:hypothetical protein
VVEELQQPPVQREAVEQVQPLVLADVQSWPVLCLELVHQRLHLHHGLGGQSVADHEESLLLEQRGLVGGEQVLQVGGGQLRQDLLRRRRGAVGMLPDHGQQGQGGRAVLVDERLQLLELLPRRGVSLLQLVRQRRQRLAVFEM